MMPQAKLFFQPILILIISFLFNIDKYDDSFIRASVHVILQAVFIYGLISLFHRWILIRIIISIFIVFTLFIQLTYDAPLSVSVVMSIMNSSPSESLSFIQFNLFTFLMSFVFLLGMIFLYLPLQLSVNVVFVTIGLSYLLIPTLVSSEALLSSDDYKKSYLKTGLARGHSELFTSVEYLIQDMSHRRFPPLRSLRGMTDTISLMSKQAELSSTWGEVSSLVDSPELLVIGIGESLRADNLGIYGYARNTTPKLSKLSGSLDIYMHAYSAGVNTWSSIPAALTKAGASPNLSKSIINLAKDAGYETFWFSNQAQYSHWDFSVSSIAKQADHVYFSSDEDAGLEYDSILVSKLLETLKGPASTKKRLIILHYYGSHMRFSDRYPAEYSYFNGGDVNLDQYDNSVLYTDFIQSEVIEIVSRYGGKYLFFADHGLGHPEGDIPLKHDARHNPNIDSVKVPFLTYPKAKMSIKVDEAVSLYYFECIFSEWAEISAEELRNGYCNSVLNKKKISFVDSNLMLHEVSLSEYDE